MESQTALLARMARYVDYINAINEVGKALTRNLTHEEVVQTMMSSLSQLLKPQHWSLLLVDPKTQELYFEIAVGDAADSIRHLRLKMGEGIAGWVAKHKRAVAVPKVKDDPRFSQKADAISNFNTQSIVCAPLICKQQVLGVLELVKDGDDPEPYTDEHLTLLTPFADFAAIAIDNARTFKRLESLTIVDEWTSLFNARFLDTCLRDEVMRAKRYQHPLSVIFFDLDRFKNVNDTLGHSAGSALLNEIGNILRAHVRETDRAVRYGGDEFVIVMPETGCDGALTMSEHIREAIASTSLEKLLGKEANHKLTASFGVATFPDHANDARMLLDRADRAMYTAKAQGRNRVCLAGH